MNLFSSYWIYGIRTPKYSFDVFNGQLLCGLHHYSHGLFHLASLDLFISNCINHDNSSFGSKKVSFKKLLIMQEKLFFLFRLVPESISWLCSRNKIAEANAIVRKVCRINGFEFDDIQTEISPPSKEEERTSLIQLFSSKKLCLHTLSIITFW